MPIYAYRCASCGHALDALQKISDPVLTKCPQCGAEQLRKQVTAAGFQLKGSGWYVTDFRGGSQPSAAESKSAPATESSPREDAKQAKPNGTQGKPASTAAPSPAAAAPAPASSPAPSSGATSKPAA